MAGARRSQLTGTPGAWDFRACTDFVRRRRTGILNMLLPLRHGARAKRARGRGASGTVANVAAATPTRPTDRPADDGWCGAQECEAFYGVRGTED